MPAARNRSETAGDGRTPAHAIARMPLFNHAPTRNQLPIAHSDRRKDREIPGVARAP
jgi:hypothetical protein